MVSRPSSTSSPTTAFVFNLCCAWLFLSAFSSLPLAHAAGKDIWRTQSIYQIITDRFARSDGSTTSPCDPQDQLYCGGTFDGIVRQLDYIQGMGFTAVWISPVVENIPEVTAYGEGYHGFWTHDINNINSHFGTADSLKNLSDELHKRGMLLMIDMVVNNIAMAGSGATADYSKFRPPFNDKKYFHDFKYITDFSDQEQVQNQWLGNTVVSLPDLNTESDYVQNVWHSWAKEMIANYSLDGIRIDAAKHVNKPFWTPFQEAVGIFTMGEVYTQANEAPIDTCEWAVDALDTVLNFPSYHAVYWALANSSNPMGGLGYVMDTVALGCHDSTLLGTFSENHDVARFASYTSDLSQQMNALVFDMMTDGIPVIYYGAEQSFSGSSDPGNREALWLNPKGYDTTAPLYKLLKALNLARAAVNVQLDGIDYTNWSGYWAYKSKILYSNEDILALRKGYDTTIITVLANGGAGSPTIGPFHMGDTNLVEGATIVDVVSCNSTQVGQYGEFDLVVKNGEPQVWVPARYLRYTADLCPKLLAELNKTGATIHRGSDGNPNFSLQSYSLALILGAISFSVLFPLFAGL